jgi:hypothetical protein
MTDQDPYPEFTALIGSADDYDADVAFHEQIADTVDTLLVPAGHRLQMTCGACPEQYDLLDEDGNMVAYFRLRWGHFYVSVPDAGGEVAYSHDFDDEWLGVFPDDATRSEHLQKGIDAAMKHKEANDDAEAL